METSLARVRSLKISNCLPRAARSAIFGQPAVATPSWSGRYSTSDRPVTEASDDFRTSEEV